jgi:RimJ/RimL family protein N-acetyltransferase
VVASAAPDAARDEGAGALVVRRWRVEDAPLMHEAVTESIEHLRPWMPWIADEPVTVEQRRERIAGWRNMWDDGDRVYGMFVGEAVVGGCGLHRRIGPGGLEIGYWVRVGHTGRGYATEAARQLTAIAFAEPGIDRVEIRHDATNTASSRVPAKLGYVRVEDLHRPPVAPAETGVDHVWRITRAGWLARPGSSA